MADNLKRKCLKCGSSPQDNANIKLYRFPKPGTTNMRRCEMWAKYCFANDSWSSVDFQRNLYAEHRMLCNKHFKNIEFINIEEKRLSKHAVPDVIDFEKNQVVSDILHSVEPVPGSSGLTRDELHKKLKPVPMGSFVPTTLEPSCILVGNTKYQKCYPGAKLVPTVISPPTSGSSKLLIDSRNEHQKAFRAHNDTQYNTIQHFTHIKQNSKNIVFENKLVSERTSKASILYKKCRKQMKKICYLRNTIKKIKIKNLLTTLEENKSVQFLMKKLTPSFALMLQSQLRNAKRKQTGRRWTLEDKILALRLFQRSPTCYRLLQRLWCLPAPSTLKSLLRQFSLNTGINENIFEGLKKHVKTQIPSDNEYILMFDEMPIRKHLWYDMKNDRILGFQDHGLQGTTQQEATYALVFMVAGIRKKIKQPVAFYLSGSNVTSDKLAVLIKEVINKCIEIGMSIAATVCDMDGVNRRALTILGASRDNPYFYLNNKQVVAIFDPPHLLKCFRNLFMKYNLKCTTNITSGNTKGKGIAKWSYIQDFYDLDNVNPNFVFAPSLRKDHLNPNCKQKMKVSLAAQVLSHSVAAGMFVKISQGELPADAITTAEIISNMDKLFDAVNSDSADLRRGKPHSTNMKIISQHFKHFEIMINFFEEVEFVGCRSPPPLKDGWVWTIRGILQIFKNLKEKHKIKSLSTRRLQQDALENLFGSIRANCGAKCNPISSQIIDGLKTSILSNLAHIGSGSCETDSYTIMDNFKDIFSTPHNKQNP